MVDAMGAMPILLTRRRARLSQALPKWRNRDSGSGSSGVGGDEKLAGAARKARANILRDWFNIIMANQEDLARIMTLEQGVIAKSRQVAYGASY